jgi:hypothetical protein
MARNGHTDDSTDHYADVIGPDGAEKLIIAEGHDWCGSDEILIATEDYVSVDDWR